MISTNVALTDSEEPKVQTLWTNPHPRVAFVWCPVFYQALSRKLDEAVSGSTFLYKARDCPADHQAE